MKLNSTITHMSNSFKRISTLLGVTGLLCLGTVVAQRPRENASGARHPNLAAAQRLSEQAFEKVGEAQKANEWDMAGHAQKAKNLLDEVNRELKMAAEAANHNRK